MTFVQRDMCEKGLHPMSGNNLMLFWGYRRCRACRRKSDRTSSHSTCPVHDLDERCLLSCRDKKKKLQWLNKQMWAYWADRKAGRRPKPVGINPWQMRRGSGVTSKSLGDGDNKSSNHEGAVKHGSRIRSQHSARHAQTYVSI